MKLSIRTQLLIVFTIVFTIALALFGYLVYREFSDFAVEQAKEKIYTEVNLIAQMTAPEITAEDIEALRADTSLESPKRQEMIALMRDIQEQYAEALEIQFQLYYFDPEARTLTDLLIVRPTEAEGYPDTLDVVSLDDETYDLVQEESSDWYLYEPYKDDKGVWMAGSAPITDTEDNPTGAFLDIFVGADDPLGAVQRTVQETVLVAAAVAFPLLLIVVFLVSYVATHALNKLIDAAELIEKDDTYQPESLSTLVKRRDELGTLARTFDDMAQQVKLREQALKDEVVKLKIEIDVAKQRQQVEQITDSDYFREIKAKSAELRQSKGESASTVEESAPTAIETPAPTEEKSEAKSDDYFASLRSKAAAMKNPSENPSES
jgi:hypothetical protein